MNLEDLAAAIQRGDARAAQTLTASLVDGGTTAADILNRALLPAMSAVGARFRDREIFLPDVLLTARAMKASMRILDPLLLRDAVPHAGTIVLGTVRGDLHDIGKNLVSVMLQGAGFKVIDLGTDVEADAFIDAAVDNDAKVIGMSALLTTTMIAMEDVVRRIDERGLRGRIRTIVGGAPLNEAFAEEIGADGYARDAVTAVEHFRAVVAR
ncbi:MAG TPA: corrinoid protein [Thermoanaerobaculia bacterium]|nr:corrinoid protein [Thermoanaerobaculia bacterium]